MKVLNILTSSLNYSGIGMSLLNYYNNMNHSNVIMDFLVPNKVDLNLKKNITKYNNKLFEFHLNGKKMHQRRPIKYCIKLYKLLKHENYDIVHVHGSSSLMFMQLFVAKMAGVKIRIAHSRNTEADHNKIHKIFKPLFKLLYTDAFACGKEAGEWLFGKNETVFVVPNGKDPKMFSFDNDERIKYRKEYNLDDKIVIGHVGNFYYQKNHEFLINVFNELYKKNNSYFLILIGSGELENPIKDKIKKYNLENAVLMLGEVPNKRVASLLNAMDFMMFPSHFEGFPNVLIEWQMNGLPCLIADTITKSVGITNLVKFLPIDDKNCWVNEAIKTKIIDRNTIKEDIIKQVKKAGYDIVSNANNLEKKYKELLENRR